MKQSVRVRKPVKRIGAEKYLLFLLLSFAASVSLTRLFLQLTGYPKLGSGGLHIAHVLWGGLFLFVSALLPLILANRWVYDLSALLAGTGVGLFIDEVGKFITQNNDYFFPAAAPIIYAVFLITVLVYLQIRRPSALDPRAELYHSLEAFEEVLDRDLDVQERDILNNRLLTISSQVDKYPDLASLANELHKFLYSQVLVVYPDQPTWLERWQGRFNKWSARHIDRARLRVAIILGLGLAGILALLRWIVFLYQSLGPETTHQALVEMTAKNLGTTPSGLFWFSALLVLEGLVGMALLAGGLLIIFKKVRQGINLGYYGLLLSLTIVNLLLFYFDQFSTILIAILQFIVLLGMIYYRRGISPASDGKA